MEMLCSLCKSQMSRLCSVLLQLSYPLPTYLTHWMCEPMPVPNTIIDDKYDLVGYWGLMKSIECPSCGYAIEFVSSKYVSIVWQDCTLIKSGFERQRMCLTKQSDSQYTNCTLFVPAFALSLLWSHILLCCSLITTRQKRIRRLQIDWRVRDTMTGKSRKSIAPKLCPPNWSFVGTGWLSYNLGSRKGSLLRKPILCKSHAIHFNYFINTVLVTSTSSVMVHVADSSENGRFVVFIIFLTSFCLNLLVIPAWRSGRVMLFGL
jgi:hypothetical protein